MKDTWSRLRKRIFQFRYNIRLNRAKRWVARGESRLSSGAVEDALACSRRSLSLDNNLGDAYSLMARALMPGDDYMALISRFHDFLRPDSYIEIGVQTGKSLRLVNPQTKAIGIDPSPSEGIESHAKLYKMSSNEFFESFNLLEELGTSRLALAFIDGLHHFDQVLMDFINIERYGNKDTVVLFHDCLPITRLIASRDRSTRFWCGDVWKLVITLLERRPDLRVFVIPTPPSGLGVITSLDPNSTVLAKRYDSLVAEYQAKALDYDFLDFDKLETLKAKFNLVSNDWDCIVKDVLQKT